jgi:hypothetical protein
MNLGRPFKAGTGYAFGYDGIRDMFLSTASNLMNQFTSKERDAEMELDYFLSMCFRFLDVRRIAY